MSKIPYDPSVSRVRGNRNRETNLEASVVKEEKDCDQETNSVKTDIRASQRRQKLLLSLTSK